jgi:hypothetical protein
MAMAALRKGEMIDSRDVAGKTRLRFYVPARGLIGYKVRGVANYYFCLSLFVSLSLSLALYLLGRVASCMTATGSEVGFGCCL